LPFANPLSLADHFKRHRSGFANATTAADYEALADKFMTKAVSGTLREGKRSNGYRVRFDTSTREFCVANKHGILTFYKVAVGLVKKKGGSEKYFLWECGR